MVEGGIIPILHLFGVLFWLNNGVRVYVPLASTLLFESSTVAFGVVATPLCRVSPFIRLLQMRKMDFCSVWFHAYSDSPGAVV